MTNREDARTEVLERIQRANLTARQNLREQASPEQAWQALPRTYTQTGRLEQKAVLELFEHRLDDYGAHVFHTRLAKLPEMIERVLAVRRKQKILIPAGIPAAWLPASIPFQVDDEFAAAELDRYDGILTAATVAIATTGTIVMQNVAGQGRRALSLIPDYHLCIVAAEQVVETVPEAFARLAATTTRPTTFISGPSATADIEMTRIQGVHGPRFLDVFLFI